jgi:hypothetical protein
MNHDKIPLNPPFSKGEVFLLPLVSDPERSLSELECSPSRKLTRREKGETFLLPLEKGGREGFYDQCRYYYETPISEDPDRDIR